MTRNYLINYLIENECYPSNECDSTVSQLWHNALNGEICYVPYEEELSVTTYCHIFYELKVNAPLEYESEYHVYSTFREHHLKEIEKGEGDN